MAAGGGVTYPEVVRLLKEKVAKNGQRTVSRETGIALLSIQRYLKGQGEPTTATLQKLSDYFGVSVAELRGEEQDLERRSQIIDKIGKLTGEDMLQMVVLSLFSDDKKAIIEKLKSEVGFTDDEANMFIGSIGKSFGKDLLPNMLEELHITIFKPLIDATFKITVAETDVVEKEIEAICTEVGSNLRIETLEPALKELALMPASELPGIAAIIKRFRENESFNLEARKLLNNSIAHSK